MITLLNLLAALALLVWGTHIVRTDVLSVYGVPLRRLLGTSIARRHNAFFAGLGVTGLVQSSNATAVIVCGFVSQGLVGLAPALAIMLGADVGSALMAGVLSFDLSWFSPLLIVCGVSVYLSRRDTLAGHLGRAAIGLGLILMALELIGQTTRPLTEAAGLKVLFSSLTGDVLLDAFIGALLAIGTYSSLAAVLLAATLAGSGVISLEVGLALVVGANLGSGVLALLGASRHNAAGRRVALGSMLFRVAGAVAVLPFLAELPRLVQGFTADPRAGVVAFHVVYNTVRCALLLTLVTPMARLCERLVPADNVDAEGGMRPRHLDPAALATPSLALAGAKREVLRMGEIVEQMLTGLLPVIRDNDRARAQEVRRLDDQVDALYTAVKLYLARLPGDSLDGAQRRRWNETIELTIKLEQAGDIIDRIVSELELKKIGPGRDFSSAGLAEVCDMHGRLVTGLVLGLSVFLNHDVPSAQRLLAEKQVFRDLERAYARSHLTRLAGETPQSIETSALHLDLISDMKRLHSLFCSAAYPVLEAAGLLPRRRVEGDAAG